MSLMILLMISFTNINAQDFIPGQLWPGLRQPQPEAELPKGKAPFQTAERVAKRNIPTVLAPVQTGEWMITDGWELTDGKTVLESGKSIFDPQLNTAEWYNATVPGTILTTLVNQGVYPDPYFGLNNMNIPESLSRTDWWYRCKFTVPNDAAGKQLRLLF
ncbi:MAG: glycoside hydrolase family 2, partial [Prevotella sp.]|nr:glycoside hydrolase family 2 [Prevotella sp.]